jgi:2-dehydro-3-deoxygalactonokinase
VTGLIGLDWGTSSLRAMRFDVHGHVIETRQESWGIRMLPEGGFEAALDAICKDWPGLPILAIGMVGSRQGWKETGYIDTPATVTALAKASVQLTSAGGRHLHIVPGVRDANGPDVMRGEETQVFGALSARAERAEDSWLVLPGTHSKWVHVRDGHIHRLHTMMTGELYALLRTHSILGADVPPESGSDRPMFLQGVKTARSSGPGGALSQLFSVRARVLDGRMQPASVPEFLSGLLIGEELRVAHAAGWTSAAPLLVGDGALCERYRLAATLFDETWPAPCTHATARGLHLLAGLIGDTRPLHDARGAA